MTPEEARARLALERARAQARARAQQAAPVSEPSIPEAPGGPVALSPESTSGTALRGFGQGASFGFSDEMSGLYNAAGAAGAELGGAGANWLASQLDSLGADEKAALLRAAAAGGRQDVYEALGVGKAGKGGTAGQRLLRAYAQARGVERGETARAAEANPGTFTAAEVAGALAVPMPSPAKLGRVNLTRLGQRGVGGVLQGAPTAAGYSGSDIITPEGKLADSPGNLLRDIGAGAAFGGVAGPLMGAAGDKAGNALRRLAASNAWKALGGYAGIGNLAQKMGIKTPAEQAAFAREMLEVGRGGSLMPEKVIRPFRTSADVVTQSQKIRDEVAAPMIEDAIAQAVRPIDSADAAMQAALTAQGPEGLTKVAQDKARAAARLVKQISEEGPSVPLRRLNKVKQDIQAGINYGADPSLKTGIERDVARGAKEFIEDEVGRQAGPEVADQLRASNRLWGQMQDVYDLSSNDATREAARRRVWTALAGGGALSALGGLGGAQSGSKEATIGGVALPLVAALLYPRMASTNAAAQRALAPVVAPALERLAGKQPSRDAMDVLARMLKGQEGAQ